VELEEDKWNAELYQNQHDFVWEYGKDLITLLNPLPNENILDLGCGNGELSNLISKSGAKVIGIDQSEAMIQQAIKNFPSLDFRVIDARDFSTQNFILFDSVFSNATLHWIPEADLVLKSINTCLKIGGRLVIEFGGKNNVKLIRDALKKNLSEKGLHLKEPWYFPSLGEYTSLLESCGFTVELANYFSRPTTLLDTKLGLKNWLNMFCLQWLNTLSREVLNEVFDKTELDLKSTLFKNNQWVADYRRLRILAYKTT
jgi:trans-aconitate 2-methyltransferase